MPKFHHNLLYLIFQGINYGTYPSNSQEVKDILALSHETHIAGTFVVYLLGGLCLLISLLMQQFIGLIKSRRRCHRHQRDQQRSNHHRRWEILHDFATWWPTQLAHFTFTFGGMAIYIFAVIKFWNAVVDLKYDLEDLETAHVERSHHGGLIVLLIVTMLVTVYSVVIFMSIMFVLYQRSRDRSSELDSKVSSQLKLQRRHMTCPRLEQVLAIIRRFHLLLAKVNPGGSCIPLTTGQKACVQIPPTIGPLN